MNTESKPKSNRTWMVVAIVAGIFLCCCCLGVGGVLAYGAYTASTAVSDVQEEFAPFVEEFESGESDPSTEETPFDLPIFGGIPQGGRGDDLLRTDTWTYVLFTAALAGCEPTDPDATEIEVTQQPDENGNWSERWVVQCLNMDPVPVIVDFAPTAQGGTDISVRLEK